MSEKKVAEIRKGLRSTSLVVVQRSLQEMLHLIAQGPTVYEQFMIRLGFDDPLTIESVLGTLYISRHRPFFYAYRSAKHGSYIALWKLITVAQDMRWYSVKDFNHMLFDDFPAEHRRLITLQKLRLSDSDLDVLPPEMQQLRNVEVLDLSNNLFDELPPKLHLMPNLLTLQLGGNQLRMLDERIALFRGIDTLDVSGNQIEAISAQLGSIRQLQCLQLAGNQLTQLPEAVVELHGLTTLDVSNNQLTDLPETIGHLLLLKHLSVAVNQVRRLPWGISYLESLLWLDIRDNPLQELPASLPLLFTRYTIKTTGIEWACCVMADDGFWPVIRHAQIEGLCMGLQKHPQLAHELEHLDLSGAMLTSIGPEIAFFSNMVTCDLSHNQLSELPTFFSSFQHLKRIDIRGNPISTLPHALNSHLMAHEIVEGTLRWHVELIADFSIMAALYKARLDFVVAEAKKRPTDFYGLTQLDLRGQQLTVLPADLVVLTGLKKIYLQQNQLTGLPESYCVFFTKVSLSYGKPVWELDIEVDEGLLSEYHYLRLLGLLQSVESKSEWIAAQVDALELRSQHFDSLDLSSQHLNRLPERLLILKGIERLDLRQNLLTELPEFFMTFLSRIRVRNGRPEWRCEVRLDEHLIPQYNYLRLLALCNKAQVDWFISAQVTSLDLYGWELAALPANIAYLQALTELNIRENNLHKLPDSMIVLLSKVQQLNGQLQWQLDIKSDEHLVAQIAALKMQGLQNALEQEESLASEVRQLDLSTFRLQKLPAYVFDFANLKVLNLQNNALPQLPVELLSYLERITVVRGVAKWTCRVLVNRAQQPQLKQLQLLGLIQAIKKQPSLKEELLHLQFRHANVTSLPVEIQQLNHLTAIDVSHNQLRVLPDIFAAFTSLQRLDVKGNQLCKLPASLSTLSTLSFLDLRGNQLTELPVGLSRFFSKVTVRNAAPHWEGQILVDPHLRKYLHVLRLQGLAKAIVQQPALQEQIHELNVANQQLERLPDEITQLRQLKRLHLYNNQLTELPLNIGEVTTLQRIDARKNPLQTLPPSLANLFSQWKLRYGMPSFSVEVLVDEECRGELLLLQLTAMARSIRACPERQRMVTKLDYSHASLSYIPESLGLFRSLVHLDLSHNHLSGLPESIEHLQELRYLDLRGNQLMAFPKGFSKLLHNIEINDGEPSWQCKVMVGHLLQEKVQFLRIWSLIELAEQSPEKVQAVTCLNMIGYHNVEIPVELYTFFPGIRIFHHEADRESMSENNQSST